MTTLLEKETQMESATSHAKRFLFAHWEGGGNTPPMLAVARRLLARGHEVRVVGDPCNREEVEALGASFVPWERAPARQDRSIASDPLRDWEAKNPPDLLRRLCDQLFVGTALARAKDVLARLEEFPADVIVTSEMLLGPMAAAEAAGVPCAALASNVYLYPLSGVPPFGPGFKPARTWVGRLRDELVRSMSMKVFGSYTEAFNRARKALGLVPVSHPFDQIGRVQRVLVQTSAAFDFPATRLPDNVTYVGPELEDPAWAEPWRSPWPAEDRRPLVLVGFSTTFQDQVGVLSRVIGALGELEVRAVVTTGPAVNVAQLPSAKNVHVCRSAPHGQILPRAAAVISHCGHGTVIRALAAGVPLVCMPMGRDQNDNAVRVTARGAGVRIGPKASPRAIGKALSRVLKDPGYRAAAESLGRRIAEDARRSPVAEMLEELASLGSPTRQRG
jgi:MGT family glycosyltransferase